MLGSEHWVRHGDEVGLIRFGAYELHLHSKMRISQHPSLAIVICVPGQVNCGGGMIRDGSMSYMALGYCVEYEPLNIR